MTLGSRHAGLASGDSKLPLRLRILSIFKVLKEEDLGLAFRLGLVVGLGVALKCNLAKNKKYEEISAVPC